MVLVLAVSEVGRAMWVMSENDIQRTRTILESFVAIHDLKISAPEVAPFTVTAPAPATCVVRGPLLVTSAPDPMVHPTYVYLNESSRQDKSDFGVYHGENFH